jgi:hypothetical protein
VAAYRVNDILVTILHGGTDFAYATTETGEQQTGVLLQRHEQRGEMVALPVMKGRVRTSAPLMSTPLTELDLKQGDWLRAVAAWGAWLVGVLKSV